MFRRSSESHFQLDTAKCLKRYMYKLYVYKLFQVTIKVLNAKQSIYNNISVRRKNSKGVQLYSLRVCTKCRCWRITEHRKQLLLGGRYQQNIIRFIHLDLTTIYKISWTAPLSRTEFEAFYQHPNKKLSNHSLIN